MSMIIKRTKQVVVYEMNAGTHLVELEERDAIALAYELLDKLPRPISASIVNGASASWAEERQAQLDRAQRERDAAEARINSPA